MRPRATSRGLERGQEDFALFRRFLGENSQREGAKNRGVRGWNCVRGRRGGGRCPEPSADAACRFISGRKEPDKLHFVSYRERTSLAALAAAVVAALVALSWLTKMQLSIATDADAEDFFGATTRRRRRGGAPKAAAASSTTSAARRGRARDSEGPAQGVGDEGDQPLPGVGQRRRRSSLQEGVPQGPRGPRHRDVARGRDVLRGVRPRQLGPARLPRAQQGAALRGGRRRRRRRAPPRRRRRDRRRVEGKHAPPGGHVVARPRRGQGDGDGAGARHRPPRQRGRRVRPRVGDGDAARGDAEEPAEGDQSLHELGRRRQWLGLARRIRDGPGDARPRGAAGGDRRPL